MILLLLNVTRSIRLELPMPIGLRFQRGRSPPQFSTRRYPAEP